MPSGRAMVGGLLVAVAMVGAVALSRSAGAPPTVPTVVASAAISPSEALGPHNLTVAELALPDELIDSTYPDPDALAGTVSRSHIGVGEVLQRGGVVESTATQRDAAPAREVSLRVDGDRAVDGRLEAGDRVDVLASYGNGIDALTYVVLADAPVLSAARTDGGVSSGQTLVLTLALSRRDDTISLAHAVDNADITVVRTTTAPPDDASTRHPFRPEAEPVPGADTGVDPATEDR
ncbi:MAG: SAF domain-containing protein [Acidimicrobiales bacterium]